MKQLALGLMARPIQKLRPGSRFEIRRWKPRRMNKARLVALSSDNGLSVVAPAFFLSSGPRDGSAVRRSELRSIADILNEPTPGKRGGR